MSERWRGSYDAWKTASPYDSDAPESQTDPGPCRLCRGSGSIVTMLFGRYKGPGPLPDPPPRGLYERDCPNCGGSGEITAEDADE